MRTNKNQRYPMYQASDAINQDLPYLVVIGGTPVSGRRFMAEYYKQRITEGTGKPVVLLSIPDRLMVDGKQDLGLDQTPSRYEAVSAEVFAEAKNLIDSGNNVIVIGFFLNGYTLVETYKTLEEKANLIYRTSNARFNNIKGVFDPGIAYYLNKDELMFIEQEAREATKSYGQRRSDEPLEEAA